MKSAKQGLAILLVICATGCDGEEDKQGQAAPPPNGRALSAIVEGDSTKTQYARRMVGSEVFVHLGWFYDEQIVQEIGETMEREAVRSFRESNLGTTSIWVRMQDEADALTLLQANSAWLDARVNGVKGFRALMSGNADAEQGVGSDAGHAPE